MIKHSLPLYPSTKHNTFEPLYLDKKPTSLDIKPAYSELLDCEEDIEVINMPISSFVNKVSVHNDPESVPSWELLDSQYLSSLKSKELEYMPNPYYLQTMQQHVSPTMRMILYDWMMEVCSELTLKRETFHLAVNYCDRYLSRHSGVKKEDYQLIGLTSMYIASKIEEVLPPNVTDWASSADNGYSTDMITYMEKVMLRAINFKVLPSTSCHWTSWLMTQWDSYIDYHFSCVPGNSLKDLDQYSDKKKAKSAYEERVILFKHSNQKAYKRFRETMQILDISLLHPNSLKFLPKYLACGLLYLMISKYFFESNYSLLYYNGDLTESEESFHENDPFRLESTASVQELFEDFIREAADIGSIEEIYDSVSFFHPFLEFEASFDLPIVCKVQSKARLESHYEDFLGYQTHSLKNLDFVQNYLNY